MYMFIILTSKKYYLHTIIPIIYIPKQKRKNICYMLGTGQYTA